MLVEFPLLEDPEEHPFPCIFQLLEATCILWLMALPPPPAFIASNSWLSPLQVSYFLPSPCPPVSFLRILVINLGLIQDNPPSLRSDDVKVQMISSFNSICSLHYLLPYNLRFYKFQAIGYEYLLGGHYSAITTIFCYRINNQIPRKLSTL